MTLHYIALHYTATNKHISIGMLHINACISQVYPGSHVLSKLMALKSWVTWISQQILHAFIHELHEPVDPGQGNFTLWKLTWPWHANMSQKVQSSQLTHDRKQTKLLGDVASYWNLKDSESRFEVKSTHRIEKTCPFASSTRPRLHVRESFWTILKTTHHKSSLHHSHKPFWGWFTPQAFSFVD